jgi:hypothetical protein
MLHGDKKLSKSTSSLLCGKVREGPCDLRKRVDAYLVPPQPGIIHAQSKR